MDDRQLVETRCWAERVAERGASTELRAAARAILLLADDVERLRAELAGRDAPGRPPRAGPSRGDRRPPPPAAGGGDPLLFDQDSDEEAAPPRPDWDEAVAADSEPAPEPEPVRPRRERRRPEGCERPDALTEWVDRLRPQLTRRKRELVLAGIAVVVLSAAGTTGVAAARSMFAPKLDALGPAANARLEATRLAQLTFAVRAEPSALRTQQWTLDGQDVTKLVRPEPGELVLHPRGLGDGDHVLEIRAGGGFLGSHAVRRFQFVVDRQPPAVRLLRAAVARQWQPLAFEGQLSEPGTIVVNGKRVAVKDDRFAVRYAPPLPAALTLTATDLAGNRAVQRFPVRVVPRTPAAPIRAVHVTAYGWADLQLRRGVLALIAQRRINAVEIDIKDEGGLVGFDPSIPLGRRIGAVRKIYDLKALIAQLHAKGIRVIGRLVCFRDPVLASQAWKSGKRDWVIQMPDGQPYSGYGGFTNFANPEVRKYQIDIAVAAAKDGIDDVLYDYVRRPDGPISSMVFPGLHGTPEHAIVEFLHETRLALRPYGTFLGASVFGVAADRPHEVAQDIPQIARQVDYVSPMVYPSHWGPGEYNVPDPNAEPYLIVKRSLRAFQHVVNGTGARLVPWLQDFTLGVTYGPEQVRAQIQAAHDDGVNEYLLWDPAVTYTTGALTADAPAAKVKLPQGGAEFAAAPASKPAPKPKPVARAQAAPLATPTGLKPNELGVVPVIMHHEIRPDRVGAYDQTPQEFRTELQTLWQRHYWPVRAEDLVDGNLGKVPAGWTPVVLTFDDSTQYQFFYEADGKTIKPTTAIGVYLQFVQAHPKWPMAGTFYVLREPFAGIPQGPEILRWLVAHGFELGDHTYDHIPLSTLDATKVQRELAKGADVIESAVPGYRIRTVALPLGAIPHPASLAVRGSWDGKAYGPFGVFLVGAEPSHSPYSVKFDPAAIPRIRSSHLPWNGANDFTWNMWLQQLTANPQLRYVSDGDPKHLTFARDELSGLQRRFRAEARTY